MRNLVNNSVDEPQPLKRKKKKPAASSDFFIYYQFPTTNINEESLSGKDKLKQKFFEAIDTLLVSLKTHFDQDDIAVMKNIETCIISAGNNIPANKDDFSKQLQQLSKFINFGRWAEEFTDLHVHVKLFNKESIAQLKKITKVSSICDVLKAKITSRRCLPKFNTLLKVYCSIALASASAERSFSVMRRRIKMWLRNTMSDNNLKSRMFSNMHKKLSDEVDLQKAPCEFVQGSETHQNYFGKFFFSLC